MSLQIWKPLAAACLGVLLLGAGLGSARDAHATQAGEVLWLLGQNLAARSRCEQAMPILARARQATPDRAQIPHVVGQCQIRLRRYGEAVTALEEAKRLDPELDDLDLHLLIARFHSFDLSGAERSLTDARARGAQGPEIDLYEGLLRLEQGRPSEAAQLLERARATPPSSQVEPMASFYAARAWRAAGENDRAREALERVKRVEAGNAWAGEAERELEQLSRVRGLLDRRDLEGQQQAEHPVGARPPRQREKSWMSASLGVEYDDNVLLRNHSVPLPSEISNENDTRLVWTAELGTHLLRSPDWTVGVLGGYYGSEARSRGRFDVHYPSATLWVDRPLDELTTARLQYDMAYAWVGNDPYLFTNTLTPALFRDWSENGTTRLFGELTWANYLFSNHDFAAGEPGGVAGDACPAGLSTCGPSGLDEGRERNRDGLGIVIGLEHVIRLDTMKTSLRAGYRHHRYNAHGSEYSYQAHELRLGAETQLPFDLNLDLQASYTYRPYRHPSSYPDPDSVVFGQQYPLSRASKRERMMGLDAILRWPVSEQLTASVRYSYRHNDSETDVFDYDRHIIGAFLTFRTP